MIWVSTKDFEDNYNRWVYYFNLIYSLIEQMHFALLLGTQRWKTVSALKVLTEGTKKNK